MEQSNTAVEDAKDMADQLAVFATSNGWRIKTPVKANKKYAFITLYRVYQQEGGDLVQEELRAFYAIDPDADDDQVTHVAADGTTTVLDPESGGVRAYVERVHPGPAPRTEPEGPVGTIVSGPVSVDGVAVPPTSAAHQDPPDGVPPTDAAQPGVVDRSAAHLDENGVEHNDMRTGAAHEGIDEASAAHPDASRDVPPTGETVVESHHMVPKADPAEVAAEACLHAEAAKRDGNDVYSQQELYGAVRHQQVTTRNWSSVASDMTDQEILTRLGVNRKSNNRVDLTWLNSLSGTLDRATVDGAAERHAPHITPKNFNPAEHGEDLRILHFLEFNGGFRSVAVARIRKFG